MTLRWTDQAYLRLAEIHDFIASDSPENASRLIDRLIARAQTLLRFPHLGRKLPELPETDLREIVDGNYRIVYRVRRRAIEVLTVFEAHRLLPTEDLPADPPSR